MIPRRRRRRLSAARFRGEAQHTFVGERRRGRVCISVTSGSGEDDSEKCEVMSAKWDGQERGERSEE